MFDGEPLEKAPGQICTQYGFMYHIDLWKSTPVREREDGALCLVVFHTTFLVFGDTTNIVATGEA